MQTARYFKIWVIMMILIEIRIRWKSDPCAVTLCSNAVTRIRTGVAAATTQSTNHYTITASYQGAGGLVRITLGILDLWVEIAKITEI